MFWEMVNLFCANHETLLTAGIIMASMIIVLIGALKPFLFNKIKNHHLRGSLLSLTNLLMCCGMVALAFWRKHISFDYYWFTAFCFCCFCIVLYWAYENLTQARAGIRKLGSFVWKKVAPIIRKKLDNVIEGLTDTKKLTSIVDDFVDGKSAKTANSNKNNDTKGL